MVRSGATQNPAAWIVALSLLTTCSQPTQPTSPDKSPLPQDPIEKPSKPDTGAAAPEPLTAQAVHRATADGWYTFRGTPGRTGRSVVAGPRSAKLAWVFRTQGRVYADAAIAEGGETVYVASHDRKLYAVDRRGREKWS